MSILQGFFGPPDIEQLRARNDLDGLIKALAYQKDEFVRAEAADALGNSGDSRAVEPLIGTLNDERWRVRVAVVNALGRIGDARATDALIGVLQRDQYACGAAAEALGRIGDERALAPLIAALDNPNVGDTAVVALGNIGQPAVAPLCDLLTDLQGERREAATRALAQIGSPDSVEPLIGVLDDRRKSVRVVAASALHHIGEPAIEPLVNLLRTESESDLRASAATILRKIGGPQVVDALIPSISDHDTRIRQVSIWALGELGDERAIELLINALTDRYEDVRYAAGIALVKIGTSAIPPLVEALTNPNKAMRSAAASVLDRLDWFPNPDEAGAAYWIVKDHWNKCFDIGEPAVGALIRTLDDDDHEARRTAAEILGHIPDPRAVEPLIRMLNDDYVDVCVTAAESLGRIKDLRAVEPLIHALSDPYDSVCMAAATALGDLGDQRAIQPLISILGDRDLFWVTSQALKKLGTMSVEPLIHTLHNHPDELVRQAAARTLGQMGYGMSVESLVQATQDRSVHVRWAAVEALGSIGQAPAARPLVELLRRKDLHWVASKALRKIGAPAIEPLMTTLTDPLAPVRRTAVKVLGQIGDKWSVMRIIPLMQDEDSRVRIATAEALGNIGDIRGAEPLVNALLDPDWDVRRAAVAGLTAMGIHPDDSEMGAFYLIAQREWAECAKIGENALAPLVATLLDPDSFVREGAAMALGKIGDPRTVDPLLGLLHDPDENVRQEVAQALGKIADPRAVLPLSELARDEFLIVRKAAVYALINIGPAAIEPLATVLAEPDEDLRRSVVQAMSRMDDTVVPLIVPYLRHRVAYVRASAAEILGNLGNPRTVRPLVDLLTDSDDAARKAAAIALGQIGDDAAVDPLVAALKYADADMQLVAARALEQLGWIPDRSAAAAAFWITRRDWDRCYRMGDAAVEPLIAALRSKDKTIRVSAAETLGRLYQSRRLDAIYKERVRAVLEDITDPFVDDTLMLISDLD